MSGNFYATLAQVLPLLLLAFIWDSGYLTRLRGEQRPTRRAHPAGVRFWTKPRVRAYTLTVAAIVIASMAVTIAVLAGLVPDSIGLRIGLSAGLMIVLATLLFRIAVDVIQATAAWPEAAEPPVPGAAPSDGGDPGPLAVSAAPE